MTESNDSIEDDENDVEEVIQKVETQQVTQRVQNNTLNIDMSKITPFKNFLYVETQKTTKRKRTEEEQKEIDIGEIINYLENREGATECLNGLLEYI